MLSKLSLWYFIIICILIKEPINWIPILLKLVKHVGILIVMLVEMQKKILVQLVKLADIYDQMTNIV